MFLFADNKLHRYPMSLVYISNVMHGNILDMSDSYIVVLNASINLKMKISCLFFVDLLGICIEKTSHFYALIYWRRTRSLIKSVISNPVFVHQSSIQNKQLISRTI